MKWYIKLFRFLFIHQRRFECCANCKNVSYGFRCDKVFGDWYGYESGVSSRFWCKNYKIRFKTLEDYISSLPGNSSTGFEETNAVTGCNNWGDGWTIGVGGDYATVALWEADQPKVRSGKIINDHTEKA